MSTSRRQFLVRGAGLAATATVPASLLAAAPALAAATDETKELSDLVGLEQASALMYTTIGENKSLSPDLKKLVDEFHDQEEEHVTAFSEALDQLGEDAPSTPGDVADVDELAGLDKATSEKELLGFAIALEERLVASYIAATSEFETDDIIRSGSQVGANHMQHLVALRLARGDDPADAIALPKASAAESDVDSSSDASTSSEETSTSTDSTDSTESESTSSSSTDDSSTSK